MSQLNEANEDSTPLIGAFCLPADSTICQSIVDALKEEHFNIVLHMEMEDIGNIIDEMERISVVIIFISKKSSESDFLSFMLTISSMEGKPLLPIIIGKDFEPTGELGLELAGYTCVRWHNEKEFPRFINDMKKYIGDLLPLDIPTSSNNEILAKFDSIISLFDDENASKSDVDRTCQSICEFMKSSEETTEDPTSLLPVAVEIFLKYNIIMNQMDDRFIEFTKHTGAEIVTFLYRTIENAAKHKPFANDHKRAQETFSRIFNSLATFPTTIYFLNEGFMLKNNHQGRILFWGAHILQLTCFPPRFNSEQDAAKFPDQQIVFQMWLKHIDKNIQLSRYSTLVDMLLGILWSLSANVSLVPLFVDACFPSTILSWLSRKLWNINKKMTFRALCMIYNYARHEKGAEALNLLGAAELLNSRRDYLINLMDEPESSIVFDITLALLYQPENINDETLNIESILKELFSKTLSASQNLELRYGVLPLTEFFLAFNILFINEELIQKSMEVTIDMNFFPNLLLNTPNLDSLAQILLLNVIYRMTSITNIKHELDRNELFLNKLNDLKNQNIQPISLPKYTVDRQIAINGILRNLGKIEQSSEMEASLEKAFRKYSKSTKKKVMISYSHDNQGFCKALVNELKKNSQLDIWVDYERLTEANGYPFDHIEHAMHVADKVICILTKDYFASPNCPCELGYAINTLKLIQKNTLIPIHIGKKFKPPGGWNLCMTNIQYIRFNEYLGFDSKVPPSKTDPLFKETIKTLQDRILHDVKDHSKTHDAETIVSAVVEDKEDSNNTKPAIAPTTPLSKWKKEDIAQWLASIPVTRKLTDLYAFETTQELLEYAYNLRDHEDINYIDIKERFTEKCGSHLPLQDFLLLKNAFEQLIKNNQPTTSVQSQLCTLM